MEVLRECGGRSGTSHDIICERSTGGRRSHRRARPDSLRLICTTVTIFRARATPPSRKWEGAKTERIPFPHPSPYASKYSAVRLDHQNLISDTPLSYILVGP